MGYDEIANLIESIGLPYSYYQFPEGTAQECPFICFWYPERTDTYADDSNYKLKTILYVELYTDEKDLELESSVEQALQGAGLSYNINSAHIDDEKMWQTTYSMEVYING